MSVLYVSIGVSMIIALGFLIAFLWAMKNGQYEDDYTPSVRILFEDSPASDDKENTKPAKETFCDNYKKSKDQQSTKKIWK